MQFSTILHFTGAFVKNCAMQNWWQKKKDGWKWNDGWYCERHSSCENAIECQKFPAHTHHILVQLSCRYFWMRRSTAVEKHLHHRHIITTISHWVSCMRFVFSPKPHSAHSAMQTSTDAPNILLRTMLSTFIRCLMCEIKSILQKTKTDNNKTIDDNGSESIALHVEWTHTMMLLVGRRRRRRHRHFRCGNKRAR